jgi:hypothetical protein
LEEEPEDIGRRIGRKCDTGSSRGRLHSAQRDHHGRRYRHRPCYKPLSACGSFFDHFLRKCSPFYPGGFDSGEDLYCHHDHQHVRLSCISVGNASNSRNHQIDGQCHACYHIWRSPVGNWRGSDRAGGGIHRRNGYSGAGAESMGSCIGGRAAIHRGFPRP